MIKFEKYTDIPKDFTGVCKILMDYEIHHYKNGKVHREDGPAKIFIDKSISWWLENKFYGTNTSFTTKTWKEFVENLKREEELNIFK